MAITYSSRVGRTRLKLAKLLREAVPGLAIEGSDLNSNLPVYARPEFDCSSWDGYGFLNGVQVHVYSWDTMSLCLKKGIDVIQKRHEIEVSRKS